MKTLLVCEGSANQVALAHRLHAVHPLSHIARITLPAPKIRRKLVPRIAQQTLGRPLVSGWNAMMDEMARRFGDFPGGVERSTHLGTNGPSLRTLVEEIQPELVLVSGTDLLRQPIIDAMSKTATVLNLHTGISPYIKGGPNCTNWALSLGEPDMIGNSIMRIDAGIDSGNLVATERTAIDGMESLTELHIKVMDHAHDLYARSYARAVSGKALPSVPQDELGKGRLFLTRHWDAGAIIRAVRNHQRLFGKPLPPARDIRLVSLDD